MLDVKYYKDYRHNYLILKDNGCLSENVYQRKMVTENKIRGLLESQERHINGEILLYCEITSRQSLLSICDGKSIGMEQLRTFFLQLKMVNDLLQKFLLDGNCLVLQPEYIFQDIETGEYSFLYYPDPEEGSFAGLVEFLLAKVDNEDMEAVETVYKIADLAGREQFAMDEVLRWFQDDWGRGGWRRPQETGFGKAPSPGNGFHDTACQEADSTDEGRIREENRRGNRGYGYGEFSDQSCSLEKPSEEKVSGAGEGAGNEGERDGVTRKRILRLSPLWAAGAAGICVLLWLRSAYSLSYQEETFLMAGLFVIAAVMAGSVLWLVYSCFLKKTYERRTQEDRGEESRFAPTYESMPAPAAAEAGNTVYIPWMENCENKLYSMDGKNKCHIDLGRLPLTVGKLAGAVDMVIDEKSVSRMHAKFSRTENNVYITDLNSTNGTFRNGMRLLPNASERIEPGDEIRLGKLKFIYR